MSLEELHEKYKFLKKMDKNDIEDLLKFILIDDLLKLILITRLEEYQVKIEDFYLDCSLTLGKKLIFKELL